MKIGFTGTRNGMTVRQAYWVRRSLIRFAEKEEITELHHGDCVGADDEFHFLCCMPEIRGDLVRLLIDAKIIIHPGYSATNPDDLSFRAGNNAHEIREPKQHFARNRDIVNECDVLIATPPAFPLPTSGGTAYTVNYAKKQGKTTVIVYPDGSME